MGIEDFSPNKQKKKYKVVFNFFPFPLAYIFTPGFKQ